MLLENERTMVVDFGIRMSDTGLAAGTSGNLSVLNKEKGLVAISPSGLDYHLTLPEDVAVVTLGGEIIEGSQRPSSELNLHLALYQARPDISAVVHTHSVYATTMACLHWEIPPVHYLVGFSGKKVPLAKYATFGSAELAEEVASTIKDYNAVLLANHGLVTVGPDISYAFTAAEEIEFVARLYYQTKSIGEPIILPEREMSRVIDKFKSYGQKKR